MRRFLLVWMSLLGAMAALAGCGAQAGTAPGAAVRPTSAAGSATAAAPAGEGLAALPQSRTSEGYHVLGDPGAPVTIEFYSDFL